MAVRNIRIRGDYMYEKVKELCVKNQVVVPFEYKNSVSQLQRSLNRSGPVIDVDHTQAGILLKKKQDLSKYTIFKR